MLVVKTFSFISPSTKIISPEAIYKNLEEIKSVLGEDLIEYIQSNYRENFTKLVRYCIKNQLDLITLKKLSTSEVNPNKYKRFDGIAFRNDKDDADYLRGSAYRGKPRPEHSHKLKGRPNIKNKKENWTNARLEYHQKMNSIAWKRKILENKNILVDGVTDSNIERIYSELLKDRFQSKEYKEAKVKSFLKNQKYYFLYEKEELENLLSTDVHEAFVLVNSIISTYHTLDPSNKMGAISFVRNLYRIEKLPKCTNNKDFFTRSSLESDFIDNFILKNIEAIDNWSYENETFTINNKLYTPDFSISINGKKYTVELKGYLRNESHFNKIVNTTIACSKITNYVFLTNPNITLDEFLKLESMEIYKKTHDQEFIEPVKGISIGLTRDQIIKNLEKESLFINNGLYFYTIDPLWKEVNFYLLLNNKCISEIVYDLVENQIKAEMHTSNLFSKKLKEHLDLHLDQFEIIKSKKVC